MFFASVCFELENLSKSAQVSKVGDLHRFTGKFLNSDERVFALLMVESSKRKDS